MSERRIATRDGAKIALLMAGLLLCSSALLAQTRTAPAATATAARATASTRPCSANPVLAPSNGKKKGARQPKNPLPEEPAPACVEVKGEAIEVQEFLQNTAREEGWRIGENRASEDTWSYVRYLDAEELEKFANTKVSIEPVAFSSGKAAVTVRTSEIGEGYVRVQITAHFQGEGKSTDKNWGQPGSVWPLETKGVLERGIATAMQTRYKPLE